MSLWILIDLQAKCLSLAIRFLSAFCFIYLPFLHAKQARFLLCVNNVSVFVLCVFDADFTLNFTSIRLLSRFWRSTVM